MSGLFRADEVAKLMSLAGSAARGRTLGERLCEAYAGTRELVPHTGGTVWVLEPAKDQGEALHVEGLGRRDLEDYIAYYRHHDPMAGFLLGEQGRVKTLSDAATPAQVGRLEFSDLLARTETAAIAGYSEPIGGGRHVAVAFHRARGMPDFDEHERALLGLIVPVLVASAKQHLHRPAPLDLLTPAERTVVALLMRGSPDRAIARHLGIGFATVRTHIQSAFAKLGVSSRVELLHAVVRGCSPLSPG